MRATVRAAAMARMDLRIDDEGQAAALPGLLSSWSPSTRGEGQRIDGPPARVRQTARCRDGDCGVDPPPADSDRRGWEIPGRSGRIVPADRETCRARTRRPTWLGGIRVARAHRARPLLPCRWRY